MNQDGIDQQLRDIAASTITRLNPENKIIAITIHTTEGSKRRVAEIVYRTGDVDSAIIVDQFGQTSFSEIFWEQERQIAKAKYGKIDRVLNDALPGLLRSVEQIEVEIAVAATITPPTLVAVLADARVSMDVYDSWRLTHANKLVALFDSQKVELRAWLRLRNAEIVTDPAGAPMLTTRLAPQLLAELASLSSVSQIRLFTQDVSHYTGDYAGHQSMNYSPPAGYLANGLNCVGSCDGGTMTVGIWEADSVFAGSPPAGLARNNLRIAGFTGPYSVTYDVAPKTCASDIECDDKWGTSYQNGENMLFCRAPTVGAQAICVQAHPSYVAAAIGSQGSYDYSTQQPGGAFDPLPNAPIGISLNAHGAYRVRYRFKNTNAGNAGSIFGFLFAPTDGSPPASYVNRSADPTINDVDWATRTYGAFFTHAAGNSGETNPPVAVGCGELRNILCVGSYDYQTYSAIGTHNRSSFSSFANPSTAPTLERPHLLGPGAHIGDGINIPYISVQPGSYTMAWREWWLPSLFKEVKGTSFAAPAVLGLAVQAHQYEGWFSALAYPVVNKAVLLASTRDILNSGGVADGRIGLTNVWFPQPADALDGGGQINANFTKQILDSNQYFFGDLTNSQFVTCGTNCREFVVGTVAVPVGQQLRVALAFQGCPTLTSSQPSYIANDFDLVVTAPGNVLDPCTRSISSASVNSEVEMIETTACLSAKTHTIRLRIKNGATFATCPNFGSTERVGVAWSKRLP